MKFASSTLLLTTLLCSVAIRAQTPAPAAAPAVKPVIVPPLDRIADATAWRLHNRAAQSVADAGRPAVHLDAGAGEGIAWLVGSDFAEGTIDVDLRGRDVPGASFVGLAFHGADDATYDAVYFRAFNFRNPDIPRRARAVQYVSQPENTWSKLRADFPGKYEGPVNPVPDPAGWFHARLVVEGRRISVFVDGAATPSLVVTALNGRSRGPIGLWVGDGSDGTFANLRITPR